MVGWQGFPEFSRERGVTGVLALTGRWSDAGIFFVGVRGLLLAARGGDRGNDGIFGLLSSLFSGRGRPRFLGRNCLDGMPKPRVIWLNEID